MNREERDPTDLGLSPLPSEEDVEPRDAAPEEPAVPASPEHRARVIARATGEHGWSRRARPVRRCRRAECLADAHQWCRRTVRAGREFGYVHPDR